MIKPFNLTDRQDYYDVSLMTARAQHCDMFQLKYDGWWCRLVVDHDGRWTMYSRNGRALKSGETRLDLEGVYIGEYMFGTNWAQNPARNEKLFLFDCWSRLGVSLETLPYRDRYKMLLMAVSIAPDWCILVSNFKMEQAEAIWESHVENGEFEGVVYCHSNAMIPDKLFRMKKTVTDEYTITGVEVGEGKFAGMAGTLICKTPTGATARIGGGFSDALRQHIFDNFSLYEGRVMEVSGKSRFEESGLLRHPNFVRFKDNN